MRAACCHPSGAQARLRSIKGATHSLWVFEKVKRYKARHLVEMTVAVREEEDPAVRHRREALPNDLVFAVSRLAALVSLSLQAVVQSAVP